MEYTLLIHDFSIKAEHGLLKKEHGKEQTFIVNSEIICIFDSASAKSDTFDESVCYGNIRSQIESIFKNHRYDTLEALAFDLNTSVLAMNTNFITITTSVIKNEIFSDCKVGIRLTTNNHAK